MKKRKTKKKPELRASEAEGRDPKTGRILKGHTINPGGQSRDKREFLERLKEDDGEVIYLAGMQLIREGNAPMIIRAWEYLFGKPKERVDLAGTISATVKDVSERKPIAMPDPLLIAAVLQRAGALPVSADVSTPPPAAVETKEEPT